MTGSVNVDAADSTESFSFVNWSTLENASTRTSWAEGQAPAAGTVKSRCQLPDTSADLTRNWLTTTAPPPFSRKGMADVVMPVRATRTAEDAPTQMVRAQSTSRVQQAERRRSGHGRHRHAVGSMRQPRSEEGEGSRARLAEERTLGWATLRRGMSIGSSYRRPGLRERRINRETAGENGGGDAGHGAAQAGSAGAGEGECVDGGKLKRKWPWDSFLKIVDKRLGKKGSRPL
ncbi:hypothetical protein JB92DRAFT_209591 [Gautieria morchelliformis]|nr:hypothetical protein JB92DRAFT_209591 [Gautieria morchelliformis]